MHVHILGIGGTFMGGIALLARALGHQVTGADAGIYPPMSTQLAQQGISVNEGYHPGDLDPAPDLVVIGNALSRGNPAVEYVLDRGLPYTSGPAFLGEQVLQGRWVLAVAGTHGKTTTACMLAWILEQAGLAPGFLIGGVPLDFGVSARLGNSPFFVVEADEYDTAFFDKRSKFVHYHPRTLILNNLEYDHADIFENLAAIKRQFHHLVRTVPASGLIVAPADDAAIDDVLKMGVWTPVERFDVGASRSLAAWSARAASEHGRRFEVQVGAEETLAIDWALTGDHNMRNAVAALAAARHAGVPPRVAAAALSSFSSVKRRMELRGEVGGVLVYDDFAHHPTAIATTLRGLRRSLTAEPGARIVAVLEPRSNTMRMGVHADQLAASLQAADQAFFYEPPQLDWSLQAVADQLGQQAQVFADIEQLIDALVQSVRPGDRVVIMSNGPFAGLHDRLIGALRDVVGEADVVGSGR